MTPHICRHTFATNMVLKGMNPAILKQILGHDDISTTFTIYTHLKADDSMDEMIRLGLAYETGGTYTADSREGRKF